MRFIFSIITATILFFTGAIFQAKAQKNLVSTTIVINEVYGGAGCGTAGCSSYNRDFIELRNISANPVDVTGWSVQYASGTSTNPTWQVTTLSGTIAPGGYYLVGEVTGAAGTGMITLPSPDASGTIAMSATTGKVALVNNSTAIVTGTLCPIPNASIIDFVGYGTQSAGTLCFEGSAATGTPSATNSVARNASGADTDNNGADFTVGIPTPQSAVQPSSNDSKNLFDFDGDNKTDISIFRPAPGEWWYLRSSDGGNSAFQFGAATDKLVPADYTGDGKTDIAIWRPTTGEFFILRSENQTFYGGQFGIEGDIPAPITADTVIGADFSVFRPSQARWYFLHSNGLTVQISFGAAGDIPVVANYDGDQYSDMAIYRPSTGEWWINRSTTGTVITYQFGSSTDKPVPGDYTGDGKADVAIWRPSTGEWFVLRSEDLSFYSFPFGANGDMPVPGDYDGDGKFDAAVFRASSSTWFVNRSTAGTLIQPFGITGDLPVPNTFVP